jgi:hypothetical protein
MTGQHQNVGGRGDHTRVFIANTRRGAQFSLGKGEFNQPHRHDKRFLKNNF